MLEKIQIKLETLKKQKEDVRKKIENLQKTELFLERKILNLETEIKRQQLNEEIHRPDLEEIEVK